MKIDLKNLDKSGWQTYRFDEIARNISQRVDPTSTDIEQYIGLEHLDKESLHIRRVGSKSEVKGQKLKCFPGDVIFGKRRAYQRKAAVVTEEAICSAHAFVLRANPEIINPSLFPFFLHSDQFMHRAVDISVGGLSPTINWGTLKSQEFLLPPKEQQGQFAELLWAMDEVVEKELMMLKKVKIFQQSLIKEHFRKATKRRKLKELGEIKTGATPSTKEKKYWGGRIPFISPAEINESTYVNSSERFLTELGVKKSRLFPAMSVLTVCIGSTIGKVAINKYECCSNQQINALIPNGSYSSVYLLHLLRYHKKMILDRAGATAVPIINKTEFMSIKLPVLKKKDIRNFEYEVTITDNSLKKSKLKIRHSKQLHKSLINQVF